MEKEDNIKPVEFKGLIEESAEDLYENAPCGYLSTLPDGTIVKVNKTFLNWLGYEAVEVLHEKKFQELLTIGSRIFYETHYMPLLRMQSQVDEINFEFKGKQKQKLPVLVNARQIKGEDGTPLLYRTTIFNITDRKKYEQELLRAKKKAEEAARVKAEFISTVSHEIRTPLNAIVSIANLLQGTVYTNEQEEYFRTLKLSADNLLNLINDILDYSKIEAGKVELAEKTINLKELVYTLLYSISISAEEKGLSVKVEIDEQMPDFVLGDPVKIGQVLTNLLSNAIKFTEKGFVSLKLKVKEITDRDVSLDFLVQDTGIGIPKDKLEKVFEEFTQADYDINLKYGGTGLGLTISQKILALYGSELTVKSEVGEGTEFSFNLRLKQATPAPETTIANAVAIGQESSLDNVKLLLVDDNHVNVLVVSKYLEKWGIDYDVAENGIEAVEKVKQKDYELVLMDLQMPGMDGYEATSSIRNLGEEKYRNLPVIAFSASARYDYKERMEDAGINDFVSKPFNATELYAKIVFYTKRPVKEGSVPAVVEEGPATHLLQHAHPDEKAPAFSLSTFEELLDENDDDLEELVRMTIRNFESAKRNLQDALEEEDLQGYKQSSHKVKITMELIHAGNLLEVLSKAQRILEEEAPGKLALKRASDEVGEAFDVVVDGLKETLIRRWQKK